MVGCGGNGRSLLRNKYEPGDETWYQNLTNRFVLKEKYICCSNRELQLLLLVKCLDTPNNNTLLFRGNPNNSPSNLSHEHAPTQASGLY